MFSDSLLKVLNYATLPGAAILLSVLIYMADRRGKGRLLMLTLSASISLNVILKAVVKIPRPWLEDPEIMPFLAEGGYAFPCLHMQVMTAVLMGIGFLSSRKWLRVLCGGGVFCTAVFRLHDGLQSTEDVAGAFVLGLIVVILLIRFWYYRDNDALSRTAVGIVGITGIAAGLFFSDGWGLGSFLAFLLLEFLDPVFQRADPKRTLFGKIYGMVLAGGIYAGLYVFLPFLVEWLVTPLWPGEALIVFLITALPCLLKFFPIF